MDLKAETQRNQELSQQLTATKARCKETSTKLKQLQKDHGRLLDKKLEGDRRVAALQHKLQESRRNTSGSSANASTSGVLSPGPAQPATQAALPALRQQSQPHQQEQEQQPWDNGASAEPAAGRVDGWGAVMAAEHKARLAAEAKVRGWSGDMLPLFISFSLHIAVCTIERSARAVCMRVDLETALGCVLCWSQKKATQ